MSLTFLVITPRKSFLVKNKKLMNNSYKNKGITLMEILVAMAIFIIASILIWMFIRNSYRVQNFSFEQSSAITEARRGIETMIKEAREALPGDNGAYPLVLAEDQEFIFYADFDRDDAVEKVHYWLDGSDFKKGVIEPSGVPASYNPEDEQTEIISRYVRNEEVAVFTYFDGDYATLTAPADLDEIKLIHSFLKINIYPDRAPLNYELESDVSIRNLKENL